MITEFTIAVAVFSLLVAGYSFVQVTRNRPPNGLLFLGLAGIEALLIIQVIIAVVALMSGGLPHSLPTFLAYLLGSLVAVPLGALWALVERSRSSTAP